MTESNDPSLLSLDLFVRRTPFQVRQWWTEFPDDYHATDPREQPFRIVTLQRAGKERRLRTHWRTADGGEMVVPETLLLMDENSWTFDVENPLFQIHDEFRTLPVEGGTRLEIRSTIRPRGEAGRKGLELQRERMARQWRLCPSLCEAAVPPSE